MNFQRTHSSCAWFLLTLFDRLFNSGTRLIRHEPDHTEDDEPSKYRRPAVQNR